MLTKPGAGHILEALGSTLGGEALIQENVVMKAGRAPLGDLPLHGLGLAFSFLRNIRRVLFDLGESTRLLVKLLRS